MKKLMLGVALTLAAGSLQAGVIRHDRDDQSYLDYAQQSQFDPVGKLLFGTEEGRWICSGTLIDEKYVLTAAHCLDDKTTYDVTFDVGGNTYTGNEWRVHQNWTGGLFDGWDIALLELSTAVKNVMTAALYTGNSELGQVGTHVGFGATGTGLDGQTMAPGTKRAGDNEIDEVNLAGEGHDRILWNDFDAPEDVVASDGTGLYDDPEYPDYLKNPIADFGLESGTALDLEYLIGGGDSGGGYFLNEGGNWYLAGVHSFGLGIDASGPNSTYGDFSGSTRVSSFVGWIGETQALMVPTPATMFLALFGLISIPMVRRRK